MSTLKRILLPTLAGLAGAIILVGLYFGIVSWAESPQHAVKFFREDRLIVVPIILGFGVQTALYVILKQRLFVPISTSGPAAPLVGAGGTTSAVAMVACCAHHVTDVLPILGLSAAAAFLAQYRNVFMWVGLGMNLVGIAVMLIILSKERRKALRTTPVSPLLESA
jgi:hypothetical protein